MTFASIVTPCYNEEENVEALYNRIKAVMESLSEIIQDYEHIYIDNASKDKTVQILKSLAAQDKRVKVIVNSRNFGHIRSPYHGILQAKGDFAIVMASDLQDPPELIREFVAKWQQGFHVVKGVKANSDETLAMFTIRKLFYSLLNKIADQGIELTKNFTGFGLYDRKVLEALKQIDDPYPYFRGLVVEVGFDSTEVEFTQPRRRRGISKNNFYTLWDIAMLGIVNHSKFPLRVGIFAGLFTAALSFLLGLIYLILKLIYWDRFVAGTAPTLIGIFFVFSVQLVFMGLLGEYIGAILTQVQGRPHVFEKERINF